MQNKDLFVEDYVHLERWDIKDILQKIIFKKKLNIV